MVNDEEGRRYKVKTTWTNGDDCHRVNDTTHSVKTQWRQFLNGWTYTVTFVAAKLAVWSIPKPEAKSPATKFTSGSAVGATSSFTQQDDKGQKGWNIWIISNICSHVIWDLWHQQMDTKQMCGHSASHHLRFVLSGPWCKGQETLDRQTNRWSNGPTETPTAFLVCFFKVWSSIWKRRRLLLPTKPHPSPILLPPHAMIRPLSALYRRA